MPEMSAQLRAERRVREDVFVTEFDRLISLVVRCRESNQATDAAVSGMCRAQIGCAMRCGWGEGWQALQVVDY